MSERLIHFFGNGVSEFDADPKRLTGPEARNVLGGKGGSLHAMTAFGLPVPPGFTIVTSACRHFYDNGRQWPPGLREELAANLARLEEAVGRKFGAAENPLLVSVRSGAAESMPGMMDTVLNCGDPAKGDPTRQLHDAVDAVFNSWMNERAVAYRREKKIEGLAGTAVTVQAMCPAAVAGVLFTINGNTGSRDEMVIEAVPGLGESLVLGEVVPDNYIVSRPDFAVKLNRPAVPGQPVLTPGQLAELGRLGLRVEEYYGYALDIEWGWVDGRFWLLQARRVKSTAEAREALRQAEIERLRRAADPAGTVWSRYNLSETLPAPLPMTWSIMRRFLSAGGGQGTLMRRLGYDPGLPADKSVAELICGRLYNNLSHDAQMFFNGYPYGHDFAALKADPQKALFPRPELDGRRIGFFGKLMFWWKAWRATSTTAAARATVADTLEKELFPAIVKEHKGGLAEDLTKLSDAELIALIRKRIDRYWQQFGADAFAATMLGDFSLEQLRLSLRNALPEAEAEKLLAKAVGSGIHSTSGDTGTLLAEVAAGKRPVGDFLAAHGHRAAGELELATPRWREDPAEVERMVAGFKDKPAHEPHAAPASDGKDAAPDPVAKEIEEKCGVLWAPKALDELALTRRYLSFRETAKHYVMMGYELIRLALLELDKRWGLHHGIFHLEESELDAAHTWPDLKDILAKRREQRELMLKIPLPDVIYSDALEQIGNPPPPPKAKEYAGLPVSPGVATGPAKLVFDPHTDRPQGRGYILVCPSTDPGWTPLFANAAGLVLERGGMLSHGALVAREYGLPAVAGIDQITRAIADGARVRVDGDNGKVYLLED